MEKHNNSTNLDENEFTPADKIVRIRDEIDWLVDREKWEAIGGVVRGVFYTDSEFCCSMVTWKKGQDSETLLHRLVGRNTDPSTALLQMIIDIAPGILLTPDINGCLPLHLAICRLEMYGKSGSSLEVIQLLVEADESKESLGFQHDNSAMQWCVWRGDASILQYLLTYPECRDTLLQSSEMHEGKVPLYYASRDFVLLPNETITPFLRILLDATAHQLLQVLTEDTAHQLGLTDPCCLYSLVRALDKYLCGSDKIRRLAYQSSSFCCEECRIQHTEELGRHYFDAESSVSSSVESDWLDGTENVDPLEEAPRWWNSDACLEQTSTTLHARPERPGLPVSISHSSDI